MDRLTRLLGLVVAGALAFAGCVVDDDEEEATDDDLDVSIDDDARLDCDGRAQDAGDTERAHLECEVQDAE